METEMNSAPLYPFFHTFCHYYSDCHILHVENVWCPSEAPDITKNGHWMKIIHS